MERTPSSESGRSRGDTFAAGHSGPKFGARDVRDFATVPRGALINSRYEPPPGDWPVIVITDEQRVVAHETGLNTQG